MCENEAAEAHNKNKGEHHTEFASHSDDSPSDAGNGKTERRKVMKELKRSDECSSIPYSHLINDAPSDGSNGRARRERTTLRRKFPEFARVKAEPCTSKAVASLPEKQNRHTRSRDKEIDSLVHRFIDSMKK
ncbi:MAG: hypothetical protein ICV60_15985 [Pyrinomonadaceae bacterium]|nr:hypothetical protein [Pyrinomonadaceae bacterium]